MKTFEMNIAGTETKWEEKSHAQIFRNFWAHFLELDAEKTIETVKLVGIRTSTEDCFIAKNGSKKKHIMLTEDLYVYAHLTPKAMENLYAKFIKGWTGEWQTVEVAVERVVDDINAMPETDDDVSGLPMMNSAKTAPADERDALAEEEYGTPFSELVPVQKGRITKKWKAQQRAAVSAEEIEETTSEQLSTEDIESVTV